MSEKKKDYLSMLADEVDAKKSKPASFNEEKFERVEKPKMHINPKLIGVLAILLVVGCALSYLFFFAPKIEMPDFVGQTTTDVSIWVKQQGIKSSGIVIKEEYDFDTDAGIIIEQSVDAGSKVKEDVKITFVASKGADPDEAVDFLEDVLSLTKTDIQRWVNDNKLTNVKFNQTYSEAVEEGYVISFDLKGLSADEFTRSSNVTFNISRGSQPAGTITLEDFMGKSKVEVEAWAKSKKIELEIYETYSDDKAADTVISQSVESGKTMKQGETLIITVSKGKAITLPNFTTMSKESFDEWVSENPNIIKTTERYSDQTGYVLSQSKKAGTQVGSTDDKIEVVVNKGLPKLDGDYIGKSYTSLVDWCNAQRSLGADMYAGQWGSTQSTYSYTYRAGTITSIQCSSYSTGEIYVCSGLLPMDARFDVVVSKGLVVDIMGSDLDNSGELITDASKMADILTSKGMRYTVDASFSDEVQLFDKTDNKVLSTSDKLYEDHEYVIQKK